MSEISVNIRGRDDGLGQQLDSLRQKAGALGVEVGNLNRLTSMTPTEQKLSINKSGEDVLRAQQSSIKSDYSEIRSSQRSEYKDQEAKFNSGEITKDQFEKFKERAVGEGDITNKSEQKELLEAEKEMSRLLRLISKEMIDKRKLDTERSQRDKKESEGGENDGPIGALLREQRQLRSRRIGSHDEDEIDEINGQLDENKRRLREYNSNRPEDKSKSSNGREIIGMASTAGQGDLIGTAMQTPSAMKGMGVGGSTVAAAGGIVAALYGLYEFLNQDQKLLQDTAPLAAMRGISGRAGSSNDAYRDPNFLDPDGNLGNLGIDRNEMVQMMLQKAQSSGIGGKDLRDRTLDDVAFKKGFGADVSGFNQFERFGGGESSSVGLDILNVLTSIKESSLKSGDLVTLSEKMQSNQTIMSIQRQKRDMVDGDASLRVLAAFESIGLSGKGEKSADFLSNTIQGLGEGGSDNAMMLKLEAAKRSRPDLANNPAALRRLVKFNSDNPEYMNEFFKMGADITGDDDMAIDDFLYTMFPQANEKDLGIYRKAMKGGDFSKMLKTKDMNPLKSRKEGLDEGAMYQDAASGTGDFTSTMLDFKNTVSELSTKFSGILGLGGSSVNVSVVEDKAKKPTTNNQIQKNKTTEKR